MSNTAADVKRASTSPVASLSRATASRDLLAARLREVTVALQGLQEALRGLDCHCGAHRPRPVIREDFLATVAALIGTDVEWTSEELLAEAKSGIDAQAALVRATLTDMRITNGRALGTYCGRHVGGAAGGLELQKRGRRAGGEAVWAVVSR